MQDQPRSIEEEEMIPDKKLTQSQIQDIYNEFKINIRNQNLMKVKEIVSQYQKDIDLVNRIDPQTRQISTFIAAGIADDNAAFEMIKYLAEQGANIKFKDQIKQTVIFYIARDGRVNLLDYVVQEKQLDLNDYDLYGQTPLFYAARENKLDFVKRMIELECNVNHVDSLSSQTALFYCAREGHTEMCRILIENGCKPSHQDASRKTAAFYAKKFSKKETIELLNNFMNKQKEVVKEQESVSVGENNKKKKRDRDVPKQTYKMIYTDEQGNQKELTNEDFEKFRQEYPQVAELITRADELIDDQMINSVRDSETWEKAAKKIMCMVYSIIQQKVSLWKAKGAFFFHHPVDPKKYGINDYFDIVKRPMDFSTIKVTICVIHIFKRTSLTRMCTEIAKSSSMKLIWRVFENCKLYNGTDSEVGKFGVAIGVEFKQLIAQYQLEKYTENAAQTA